jgi:hypothetical protein
MMAAQAMAMSRTAPKTPAAIAPERDFGANWPLTTTFSLKTPVRSRYCARKNAGRSAFELPCQEFASGTLFNPAAQPHESCLRAF